MCYSIKMQTFSRTKHSLRLHLHVSCVFAVGTQIDAMLFTYHKADLLDSRLDS